MDEPPEDEDLRRRVAALEEAMREVRAELGEDAAGEEVRSPQPPRSDDLARFADDTAIPALIFVLKANIRLLEGVRRALRTGGTHHTDREELAAVGERTLEQVEEVLDELQQALEGVPGHPEARAVLAEGEHLRSDLEGRLQAAREEVERLDIDGPDEEDAELEALEEIIDVEAELEAIKRAHEDVDAPDDVRPEGSESDADGDD